MVVERLAGRFRECATEKNGTLIRYDIIEDLRKLYDAVQDEQIRETALALIATEEDSKYRKKYATLWRQGYCWLTTRRTNTRRDTNAIHDSDQSR